MDLNGVAHCDPNWLVNNNQELFSIISLHSMQFKTHNLFQECCAVWGCLWQLFLKKDFNWLKQKFRTSSKSRNYFIVTATCSLQYKTWKMARNRREKNLNSAFILKSMIVLSWMSVRICTLFSNAHPAGRQPQTSDSCRLQFHWPII